MLEENRTGLQQTVRNLSGITEKLNSGQVREYLGLQLSPETPEVEGELAMMLDREKHDAVASNQIKRHVVFQDHL